MDNALLQQLITAQQTTIELLQQQLSRREEPRVKPRAAAHAILPRLSKEDDIEDFLMTFERTATLEEWSPTEWASALAPLLTGVAQEAYFDLDSREAEDYGRLKTEILSRYQLTARDRAVKFHQWTYTADQPVRAQIFALIRLTKQWLEPGKGVGHVIETLVVDKILRELPSDLKRVVGQGNPLSADDIAQAVETGELLKSDKEERKESSNPVPRLTPARPPPKRPSPPRRWEKSATTQQGRCYKCQSPNHYAPQCPSKDEPMVTESSLPTPTHPVLRGQDQHCWLAEIASEIPVRVEGQDVVAILDSGSMVTLVEERMVTSATLLPDKVAVSCIHGDTHYYPTVNLPILTPKGRCTVRAGKVPQLKVPLLIGRDCPLYKELRQMTLCTGRRGTGKKRKSKPEVVVLQGDVAASSSSAAEEEIATQRLRQIFQETTDEDTCEGLYTTQEGRSNQALRDIFEAPSEEGTWKGFSSVTPDGDVEHPPHPSTEVDLHQELKGQFGTSQHRDPDLKEAMRKVKVIAGRNVDGSGEPPLPYYAIRRGLLYWVVRRRGENQELLMVPRPYRDTVLQLAHSHVLGGHLARDKTIDRIMQIFYWPRVTRDVARYCRTCDQCQRTAPRPHLRNPLIPLPIIETPFERIAMDLVGPLPKSARGHEYILVVIDYATKFPEAIPLRNMSSKGIAKELFLMFSRVGLPKTILTDQGTPFMSRLMKDLCWLYQVQQIRTSIFHPQTDGLCEHLNKTIKSMLRRVVSRDGKNWDMLLPHLMFALREVPQASTGFSPFELLYGRPCRGILDLAKETWETQPCPFRSTIEHVTLMRDRLSAVWPIVKEHMEKAQRTQGQAYDKSATPREFTVGEKVMVLVPTAEHRLLAQWRGPYEVMKRVSPVNYLIKQPDRRKKVQLYHINLLKTYHGREEEVALMALEGKGKEETLPQVRRGQTLLPEQSRQLDKLIMNFGRIFSPFPGQTDVLFHHIHTEPGKKVHIRPYRIPEARRVIAKKEVREMLRMGVIEPSTSEWSSPIVLVPMSDGSMRLCNDFRGVNAISTFDAYPMPRVDELLERLGKAKFITTLDLTKGYWQVPVAPEDRPKTAFATPEGLFQYVRMPFGLHGAAATFQRLMDAILRPHQEYAAAYIDDVVIHSEDWDSHLLRLRAVLVSLEATGLTANPNKCCLGLSEAEYLGYTVGNGKIRPQAEKTRAIRDWPRPRTKRDVRAFLGITGYYRRFIPGYATIANPLTNLIRKNLPNQVEWKDETEEAFQLLKDGLCSDPVLQAPDFSQEFIVQVDASDTGLGAVLAQGKGEAEKPILFISRKLSDREQRYATVEKEALAIMWALDYLRYYLLGRRFALVTDHAPLTWMAGKRNNNNRIARWFLSLQPFSFHVIHRAGSRNGNADALSRRDQDGGASGARPSGSVLGGKVCGRTTRGQAGLMDSSPTRHGRQGNQRQLSTADGTNDILSFPYKRENGTSREGGKLSLEDGHRERGAIHEEPLRR
uniref:Gypsy retrotransposon integrase-like protein 1 n=1 Tax=Oncorhynchus kisutch TaxID=8019 RepID=A0A8C7F2V4_ONCKI